MKALTFEECCERVAQKEFGGKKLVTGHRAQFFREAAIMLAEDAARRAVRLVKEEATSSAAETILGLESLIDWGRTEDETVSAIIKDITK